MNKDRLEHFKAILLKQKTKILNGGLLTSNSDLTVSQDDLADEADLATTVIEQQVSFNMREREFTKLRAIEEALYKVEEGTYGHCEDCDEAISEKRLENQPWATLCIEHAEERENNSVLYLKHG